MFRTESVEDIFKKARLAEQIGAPITAGNPMTTFPMDAVELRNYGLKIIRKKYGNRVYQTLVEELTERGLLTTQSNIPRS